MNTTDVCQISFFIFYFIQLYFLLFVFNKKSYHNSIACQAASTQEFAVSIIICAHNEIDNLRSLIPKLLAQDHPQFEIIIVDDRSADGTNEYLQELIQTVKNLRAISITALPNGLSPKKHALTKGIEAASASTLLLTDADCEPTTTHWIRHMTAPLDSGFDNPLQVCLGYSPYKFEKGWLNKLIRFETFYTAIQYFSFAMSGFPYMGVGRNLAYRKELFFNNGGFVKHQTILSGDDDLFGNEAFHSKNTTYTFLKDSHTVSMAKRTYREYFLQKTRHLSAGLHYRLAVKVRLALLVGSQIGFYVCATALLTLMSAGLPILVAIFIRTILFVLILKKWSKNLNENIAWYWIPMLEFIYLINYILTGVNATFSNKIKWT